MIRIIFFFPLALLLNSCQPAPAEEGNQPNAEDPALDLKVEATDIMQSRKLFGTSPQFEVLFGGMEWAESPVQLPDGRIICSDGPNNRILFYDPATGEHGVYLYPAGSAADDYSSEPGSNGLHLDGDNRLLICQHGGRRVVRMEAPLSAPDTFFTVLADNYQGLRFNSPNDLTLTKDGSILFTDPIYGLPGRENSPDKELPYCGVFHLGSDGTLHLIDTSYLRPNGIDLSPDEKTLYVADSDQSRYVLTARPVLNDTFALGPPTRLIDAAHLSGKEPGSTDGLAVAENGRIFATAPGGVWVIEPDGTLIAKIRTGLPVANVGLSPAEDWLYLTSDYYLIRIKLN